jgi:type IV secretion system protein VirB1
MFPFADMMQCQNLSVPADVMHHVVQVESSANPYAIGVVGGRLVRQPRSLAEAVSTAEMLESRGYNFSVGLAQVNRYNLTKYGVASYVQAFDGCVNLRAGSRILADCHARAKGDWGSAFSCYYSGNFTTGYRHGYVQKVFASIAGQQAGYPSGRAIPLAGSTDSAPGLASSPAATMASRRMSAGSEPGELSVSALTGGSEQAVPKSAAGAQRAVAAIQQVPAMVSSPANPKPGAEGAVRLTRSGPVFPMAPIASKPAEPSLLSAPSASPQIAEAGGTEKIPEPGDNAFVF